MFSYIFMRMLENRPRSYDRRMNKISLGHIKSVKENVVREIPENAQVLEIGCGTGELATMLLTRGATITAFDVNPAMVAVVRERVKNMGLKNKLTIREMGIEGMDNLPSASYDAVVSTLVFSELTDDERHFTLMHSKRILQPGGVLVIADEVVPHKSVQKLPLIHPSVGQFTGGSG
jgi:demethylmenaquinone methyltransferase/2-methoxy-6-polyprenyl-1,4-benzoquinol methylase